MSYVLPQPLALTRSPIDRAAERRADDAWLARAWAGPHTRVLVVSSGRAPVVDGELAFVRADDAPPGERFLLGIDHEGVVYFAVHDRSGDGTDPRAQSLRTAAAVLSDRDGGLMVHAVALANWHDTHQHCPRCGASTEVAEAGHLRRCPEDGSEHYPRTDPAVIVLVTDERDRALLGRHPAWPRGRFSTLAGFVEPGETPEQAVVRELAEETGVDVESCTYAGSQPWPFPSSLMLGFYGRARAVEPRPDGVEIEIARWFSRDEFTAAIDTGEIQVPPSVSISRVLVEGWYGRRLEPNTDRR